jgi:outer membrane protein OmpA-like peptidoglycan-associated protein
MSTLALRALCLLPAALVMAGCVSMAPVDGRVLSTRYEQRFTDQAVRRDWDAMEALRRRIDAARPSQPSAYGLWRAELMLDFGLDEYQENDRTQITGAALDDAAHAIAGLETGTLDPSPPVLPAVKTVREDLWVAVGQAKADPEVLSCAGEHIARLEVALLELGHNAWEVDAAMNTPEHLTPCPLTPLVDDLAAAMTAAAEACLAPAPTPPTQSQPPARVEHLSLSAGALFRFDRCAAADMLPEGRAQLDAFGAALARDPASWQRLVITGHTDRLGRHDYNLTLSRCRADSVRNYLQQHFDLPAERLESLGLGAMQPVTFCTGPVNDALKACLQPNRRVEIEVHR